MTEILLWKPPWLDQFQWLLSDDFDPSWKQTVPKLVKVLTVGFKKIIIIPSIIIFGKKKKLSRNDKQGSQLNVENLEIWILSVRVQKWNVICPKSEKTWTQKNQEIWQKTDKTWNVNIYNI